jgi:parallel beta-helix repeat protein
MNKRGRKRVISIGLSTIAVFFIMYFIFFIPNIKSNPDTGVTNCSDLNVAGETYLLSNDILNNQITDNCINISASNITLDCQGYYIYSIQNYSGVYSNSTNTTIKNCNITMGSGGDVNAFGIYLNSSNYSTITNNSIFGDSNSGIHVETSLTANLTSNTAISISGFGIYIDGLNDSILTGNTGASNSNYGIYLLSSNNLTITSNNATSNSYHAFGIHSLNNSIFTSNIGISNFADGIIFSSSNNNLIVSNTGINNNTGVSSNNGISCSGGNYNNFTSNTMISYSYAGFIINGNYNTLNSNLITAKEFGIFAIDFFYGNITNEIINTTNTGIYLYRAKNNLVSNITVYDSAPLSTFYINQLIEDNWKEIYSSHFPIKYETHKFKLNKSNNGILLRISQRNVDFADIDELKLEGCGKIIFPKYAIIEKRDILGDVLSLDNNVISMSNKTLEILWDALPNCDEGYTLSMVANEYSSSSLFFRYPRIDFISHNLNKKIFYSLINPLNLIFPLFLTPQNKIIDGIINEVDKIQFPDYKVFWKPGTGHPENFTYIYIEEDKENIYFSVDLTIDNSEDDKDWAEIVLDESSGEKIFRINDSDNRWGKCGFGRTSKVDYNHTICEFKIPKTEISKRNFKFALKYYGTASPPPTSGAVIFINLNSNNNILTNIVSENKGYGIYITDSNNNTISNLTTTNSSIYGIFLEGISQNNTIKNSFIQISNNSAFSFNNQVNPPSNNLFYNNYFNNSIAFSNISTSSLNYFNITKTAGTNIIGGSYLAGNYWAAPNGSGFSQTCPDADDDGICDTSYSLDGINYDYLPLGGCLEVWSCAWGNCINNLETYTCVDANLCQTYL